MQQTVIKPSTKGASSLRLASPDTIDQIATLTRMIKDAQRRAQEAAAEADVHEATLNAVAYQVWARQPKNLSDLVERAVLVRFYQPRPEVYDYYFMAADSLVHAVSLMTENGGRRG